MTEVKSSKSERASVGRAPIGRLFVLDLSGGRVLSMKTVVGAEYNGHATPVFSDSMRWVGLRTPPLTRMPISSASAIGRSAEAPSVVA